MAHKQDKSSVQQRKEISLSLDETNQLRISLGLRPLRSNSPPRKRQRREEKVEPSKAAIPSLQERIEKSRLSRAQNALFSRASIAPASVAVEEESADESGDDIAAWVSRTRKKRGTAAVLSVKASIPKKVKQVEKHEYTSRDLSGIKIDHEEEILGEQDGTILTLKDTGVLDKDGKNTLSEEDLLESMDILQQTKRRQRANETSLASRNATDASEFANKTLHLSKLEPNAEGSKIKKLVIGKEGVTQGKLNNEAESQASDPVTAKPTSMSVAGDIKPQFEEDYEAGKWHSRAFSRKRKNKHKSKKRRRRDVPDDSNDAPRNSSIENCSVPVAKTEGLRMELIDEIRAKAAQEMDHDEDDENDDEYSALLNSLRRAREKRKSAGVNASVERILKIIDRADDDADGDGDFNSSAADMIFNEMEQFAQNISVDEVHAEDSDSDADMGKQLVETSDKQPSDAKGNYTEASLDARHIGVKTASPTVDSYEIAIDADSNPTADTGVAAALARFRGMGDLHERREQLGRAKDERIDWKDLDENVKIAPGQRSIKLTYTDENGHELTPKEAFRLMCHKFHGKGPSKNKREVRLRRQLQKMRLQRMANDDTPLGSTSALRSETRRTGVAHVVLSGPSAALVESSLDGKSLEKGNKNK